MGSRKRSTPREAAPTRAHGWIWTAAIVAAVLFFYWIPLTSESASIQWDAVDVHYSSQKYFADRVRSGEMPFWTPYIFSGFPFLADPQVGAWYPPNWPFFLFGIGPRAIQAELALHALIAASGAFLLLGRLARHSGAALVGALLYAFSGYFAEHSSHVGMFQTAAWLPWLLLFFDRAMERDALRNTTLAGLAGGVMVLAGHFQNSLYAFIALALFAAGRFALKTQLPRAGAVLAGTAAIAAMLSAIQTLPGLELTGLSIRSAADYSKDPGRLLQPAGLATLVAPNATGVFDRTDGSGFTDAQFYLYGGILLIPLAAAGLRNRALRLPALLMLIFPLWYMFGPSAGLYRIAALAPGLRNVRAPVHFWFVPALALAMLAAAGAAWVFTRWKFAWAPAALAALLFADLFYWNSATNPMAYSRSNFDELYGNRLRIGEQQVAATQPPLTRFEMPYLLTVLGPLNHPLDLRMEASYGYNPLELAPYAEYRAAMQSNPKLRNGLNISRYLDTKTGSLISNAEVLPRAYFVRQVVTESPGSLAGLDPANAAIVERPAPDVAHDPQAPATVSADGEQGYRIRYRSAAPAFLKIAVPYFPGWRATIGEQELELYRTDHALMGLLAPAGEKEVVLRFRSRWFGAGAAVSGAALALCAAALWFGGRRRAAVPDASY